MSISLMISNADSTVGNLLQRGIVDQFTQKSILNTNLMLSSGFYCGFNKIPHSNSDEILLKIIAPPELISKNEIHQICNDVCTKYISNIDLLINQLLHH